MTNEEKKIKTKIKKYIIEILYTKKKTDEIPLIDTIIAYIYEDWLISFSNYRFMYFKKIENENIIEFIKRTVKTVLFKEKYKFIKDIRVREEK